MEFNVLEGRRHELEERTVDQAVRRSSVIVVTEENRNGRGHVCGEKRKPKHAGISAITDFVRAFD